MRLLARLDVWYSSRSRSRDCGDAYSPRRSRSRHRSSRRSRSPREHSPLHSRRCAPTAWTHSPERLDLRERVRNAAPTNPARVETRASVCDTSARSVPRTSLGPMMLRQWMDLCDQQYNPLSSAPGLPHRQAAVGPHGYNADVNIVLVVQDDVDEAVNRAADSQLEAEAALERAAQAEKTASEICQSNRELLERMRNLEYQVHGNAQMGTQPRLMSLARRARRDGRPTYEPRTPSSEPTCEV
uniref:Uncharacterized protein n=1 Tax=Hyaloperonospora arabidopsidis (strain Emoy2) TaxID=559515 RepID=M4BT11_HYAAE